MISFSRLFLENPPYTPVFTPLSLIGWHLPRCRFHLIGQLFLLLLQFPTDLPHHGRLSQKQIKDASASPQDVGGNVSSHVYAVLLHVPAALKGFTVTPVNICPHVVKTKLSRVILGVIAFSCVLFEEDLSGYLMGLTISFKRMLSLGLPGRTRSHNDFLQNIECQKN